MLYRAIALLAVLILALAGTGCSSSKNSQYEEVLMPLQTGSVLQRRVQVPAGSTKKSTKKTEKPEKKPEKEKEKEKPPKPEVEPTATPAPEEEATPPPERFR